jgi:glycosyltransferase involved in cell wall biosynthesis
VAQDRTRVLRVIARMNVGGPAQHVSILSGWLDPERYETLLVSGRTGPGEASADHLAAERGAHLVTIAHLSPEIRPAEDARALGALVRAIRRFEPDIVHTHTAKAGFLGRLAAVLARPGRRPIVVHTYHGHVLEGYFGPAKTAVYRGLERAAARVSDALIGVSRQTVDDLVRLEVAPRERFRVVPLGLDLGPFLALAPTPDADAPLRRAANVGPDELLVTLAGRLVPIKRVEVALEAVALARAEGAPIRFAIVGDGELRGELEARAAELGLGDAVHFAGFRRDMPEVVAATDIALLTSDNEGTPVALIEAAAGARPAISTDVGGVATVVTPQSGRLSPAGEPAPLAAALVELARDPELRRRLGAAGREHVSARFGAQRLLADVDALYAELLRTRAR